MRKTTILALIVAAIMVISAAAVFSHPGWRGGHLWRGDGAELVKLEGKITDARRPMITMEADGREYILHLGPFWYWQEKEYTFEKDQAVEISGVVEEIDGVLNVYPHTIKINGESIELVDEDGVPVWAGRTGGRGPRFGRGYDHCGYGPGYGWHGRGHMHGWRGYGRGRTHGYGWHGRGFYGCGW
jgi:hypothetical protein